VGLAVCKAIANVHHARIWIEDTRDAGRYKTYFPKIKLMCP
jgi:light-regulated signal transduction histidine kinase (bacteriophytochrome)